MSLRQVEFPDKDEGLRQDVGRLGSVVGDVIREQGGNRLFERVEQARAAAIRRREGDRAALDELCDLVHGLDPDEAGELVRAFSTYFQAVNLAEQVHRVRRGRAYLRTPDAPQPGSLHHTLLRLEDRGLSSAQALEAIRSVRVEPVFTAHPTEATRRSILEKQERIAERLLDCLDPSLPPGAIQTNWERIRSELTTAWQTEEHPTERPSVRDEREHVLYYVRSSLYRVIPVLYETLEDAFRLVYDERVDTRHLTPIVRFGSWVGGDMDGNPNVDADTIAATLARHRDLVIHDYLRDIEHLGGLLTQSDSRVGVGEAVARRLEEYRSRYPFWKEHVRPRHRGMPYRVLLVLMGLRVTDTLGEAHDGYQDPAELAADLGLIEASLDAHGGSHAGTFNVRRLRRRVEAFGFHLAALDVRQDGREHRELLARLFRDPAWPDRHPVERARVLRQRLDQGPPARGGLPVGSDLDLQADGVQRALDVFAALGESRLRFGPGSVGLFIISMAEDVDDILTVLYLARLAGLVDDSGRVPLDIAPLLETVPDLERSRAVMERLLTDPVYRPHLHARGDRQTVMVGYSDSNKDGGLASARWALQKAQADMARASADQDVALTIFHGRGGTTSRGGGKIHRALEAAPPGSVQGHLRLTEQGEVIDTKYGLPSIALRSLERMVGALTVREALPHPRRDEDYAPVMQRIAEASRVHYRALVYEDPSFYPFFRSATPIDLIERMPIGSRPASRRAQRGIADLRAIPWVFAWMQCRAVLPGWYGLGTGLEAGLSMAGRDTLAEMIRAWPFLGALVDDVEMVLAKADLDIASRYVSLAPGAHHHVFDRIREEYERTVELILSLSGSQRLLEGDRTLRRSIRLRNPYVDPMSLIQVDLLERWREGDRQDPALFKALLSTVNGIARGLRNTG